MVLFRRESDQLSLVRCGEVMYGRARLGLAGNSPKDFKRFGVVWYGVAVSGMVW